MEDYVDAGTELFHVLGTDGQAWLSQLAADGDDLLVEVRVILPHTVKELPERVRYKSKTTIINPSCQTNADMSICATRTPPIDRSSRTMAQAEVFPGECVNTLRQSGKLLLEHIQQHQICTYQTFPAVPEHRALSKEP